MVDEARNGKQKNNNIIPQDEAIKCENWNLLNVIFSTKTFNGQREKFFCDYHFGEETLS